MLRVGCGFVFASTAPRRATAKCEYEKDNGVYYSTYGGSLQTIHPPAAAFRQLDDVLQYPYIRGVAHYQNWSTLEVDDGVYNWTTLDKIFNSSAAHGKFVILGLQMGVCAPEWLLKSSAIRTTKFVHSNPGWRPWSTIQSYEKGYIVSTIAVPWDAKYEAYQKRAVEALAARYHQHPQLSWVNIAGPSVSGGVETNFNVDYTASRLVNPSFDAEMNYTQPNYAGSWMRMIDTYIQFFQRSGLATHDQCGDEGWSGDGRIVHFSEAEKMETARRIRDYLVAQHLAKKNGTKPIIRCCGGNSNTKVWGEPGTLSDKTPPPKPYARLVWEVRESVHIGFEANALGGTPYTPAQQQQKKKTRITRKQSVTNAAGMEEMLEIELYYNGRFLEIKRPDIITNRNLPNSTYVGEFTNTSSRVSVGKELPWRC